MTLTTIISFITGNSTIMALIGMAALAIGAWFKGAKSGREKEQVKQLRRDAEIRRQNDGIITEADRVRAAAGADDLMSDDGNRRD